MGFQIPGYDKLADAYAERKQRIIQLLGDGVSQAEIGRMVGVSRARVNQIAKALESIGKRKAA